MVEYAMLSSQAFECSDALAQTFQLGAPENILVEGKDLKVLCIDHGQNKISIFVQKETDTTELLKTFTPQP
jgi:predicted regulator of Ras-like GTPase activity (Roadblock/LC7/MglB family)